MIVKDHSALLVRAEPVVKEWRPCKVGGCHPSLTNLIHTLTVELKLLKLAIRSTAASGHCQV